MYLFLKISVIGLKILVRACFKFITYTPTTTDNIPSTPIFEGNSPKSTNDDNNMNTGVNESNGIANDRSSRFNALKNISAAITLSIAVPRTAIINLSPRTGIPLNPDAINRIMDDPRNTPVAEVSSSKFLRICLLTSADVASKNAAASAK